jgi:hypothetical protein
MLEKDALRWELNADGHGIAKAPALAVRVAIGEDLARDLGFAVVHEASDAVSQALLTADADAELVVSGVRARSEPTTTLFTHDSERCVRVARAIRLHFPDETIRVRVTVGDPASDAHKAALDESRIDGLDFKGWYGW